MHLDLVVLRIKVEEAERLAALNIDITSTVPIGKQVIPIPLLDKKGVKVSLGNDSITDHWSPFEHR